MLDSVTVVIRCLTRLSVFLEMIEAVAVLMGIDKDFLLIKNLLGIERPLVAGSE